MNQSRFSLLLSLVVAFVLSAALQGCSKCSKEGEQAAPESSATTEEAAAPAEGEANAAAPEGATQEASPAQEGASGEGTSE